MKNHTSIINVLDKDITIKTTQKRKGIYWSYEDVNQMYGPFRSEQQAVSDAKLYSQYGTTNRALIPWTRTTNKKTVLPKFQDVIREEFDNAQL